jgi:hypothetical protein
MGMLNSCARTAEIGVLVNASPNPEVLEVSMTSNHVDHVPELCRYLFRPAIAEAKLLTGKHARDPVYVATLAEELRTIEAKITAIEESLGIRADGAPGSSPQVTQNRPDADWIRYLSGELGLRLRRIEQRSHHPEII